MNKNNNLNIFLKNPIKHALSVVFATFAQFALIQLNFKRFKLLFVLFVAFYAKKVNFKFILAKNFKQLLKLFLYKLT